jgi:hypothetical protein
LLCGNNKLNNKLKAEDLALWEISMKLRPGSGRRGLKAQNSRNQWIRNGKES